MYKWVENKFRPYLEIAAGTRIKSTRKYSRTWAAFERYWSNDDDRHTHCCDINCTRSVCISWKIACFSSSSIWDATGAGTSSKPKENKFHLVDFVKCQFTSIERVAIEIVCKNSFKFDIFVLQLMSYFPSSLHSIHATANSYNCWMLDVAISAIVIVVIIESIFRLTRASHFVCYLLIAIARWSSSLSFILNRVRLAGNSVVYVIAYFAAVFFSSCIDTWYPVLSDYFFFFVVVAAVHLSMPKCTLNISHWMSRKF